MEPRRHRSARAQREASGRTDARIADQREPVSVGHDSDDELHLRGGEGAADAAARDAPEGEVSHGRARGPRARARWRPEPPKRTCFCEPGRP
jgi:hypothetical protein